MRRKGIGDKVLVSLHKGDIETALNDFRAECEVKDTCKYAGNLENCKRLCLLPKLIHQELFGARDHPYAQIKQVLTRADQAGRNPPEPHTGEDDDSHE